MQLNKKIQNGKILIEHNNKFDIEKKDLFVENERIFFSASDNTHYDIVDMRGKIIIPCFANIHAHLGESIFKNISGNDWTVTKYIKYTEEYNLGLTETERKNVWNKSAQFTIEEMKKNGISLFCAARSSEISKKNNFNTMSGYPIMNSKKLEEYKQLGLWGFIDYFKENHSDKNSIGVFLHSVYANDKSSFELAYNCMENNAEFITVHISEDHYTTRLEKEIHNKSAISILDDYGLLGEKTILVHCGCISQQEYELIKHRKSVVAICPISNMFLNTKMPDLNLMEELGIPWCIATDGLGTGRSLSLIDQIEVARKEFPDIAIEKFYTGITTNPAKIYKRQHYTGKVEEGVESKVIIADYDGSDANELLVKLFENKINWKTVIL